MSQLESYSILEKINEWKKEEGLSETVQELPICRIPRPVKLIMELEEADIMPLLTESTQAKSESNTDSHIATE